MQSRFGLGFSLLIFLPFSHAAHSAGLSLLELQKIQFELSQLSEFHELPCEASAPGLDQDFLFDGALGFCPKYFYFSKPRPALREDSRSYQARLADTEITSENQSLIAELKKELGQERHLRNCLLVRQVLRENQRSGGELKRELHYYSKQGENSASRCAELQVPQNQGLGNLEITAIAYSMGADAGLRFARKLEEKNIRIERMLSIDPVARGFGCTTGVLLSLDNPYFKRPAGVGTWLNFFQKQDRASLIRANHFHLGIRGSRVENADLNQEIAAQDFESERERLQGHVHILKQPAVQAALFAN